MNVECVKEHKYISLRNKNNAVCTGFRLVTSSRIFSRSRLFGMLSRIFSGLAVIIILTLIIKRNRCVIIDAIFFSIDVCLASPVPECAMLSELSLLYYMKQKQENKKAEGWWVTLNGKLCNMSSHQSFSSLRVNYLTLVQQNRMRRY